MDVIDSRLVRGLDYYTNTAFEIQYLPLGAQSAICGGGRYDGLVEEIGGPATPGIGFAVGIERLLLALDMQNLIPVPEKIKKIYIAALGQSAIAEGVKIQHALRKNDIQAELDLQGKSLKGQMKQAGKLKSIYTIIIGTDELIKGSATVKDMENGTQKLIPLENVADFIFQQINRN